MIFSIYPEMGKACSIGEFGVHSGNGEDVTVAWYSWVNNIV